MLLRLFGPTGGATLGPRATAVLTIKDDEKPGILQWSAPAYTVSEAGPAVTVSVKRSGGSAGAVSVDFATLNGTATAGSDYASTTGTLGFAAGQLTQSASVAITEDALAEGNESFGLVLSNPRGGASLGAISTATVTITDNEQTLAFAAAAYSMSETSPSATITVKRLGGSAGNVGVDYAASGGTATPGLDYTLSSATLTFGPGVTSRTFAVPLVKDTVHEADETVLLTLSNPSGGAGVGTPGTTTLTILDNDAAGVLHFGAATVNVKEDAGSVTLTVTRTGGLASDVTVGFVTADGTATAGSDYDLTIGTLSFAANQISQTLSIPISDDSAPEGDETFSVTLLPPTGGASLGSPATEVVTILDNESTVQFSAPTYSAGESAGTATITVKRSGPTTGSATVQYATSNGTAVAGSDFAGTSGTLSFGPGMASRTFKVTIINDTAVEGDETLGLLLSNPTGGASLGQPSAATLTIVDNEGPGTLQFSATSYTVKEVGPTATITVQRVGGAGGTVTVDYTTADGTALAGLDYTGRSGTLSFGPGVTSQTFAVPITSDTEDEANETVLLNLSNPGGGAALAPPPRDAAVLTITDDDAAGTLAFDSTIYSVGEDGQYATITVVRSGGAASGARADYSASGGSASDGLDFQAVSGTLFFDAGVTSQSFSVPILQYALSEGGETINLSLSNAQGGAVLGGPSSAVLWIVDDE